MKRAESLRLGPWDCIGFACLVAGVVSLTRGLVAPIGPYDEGILLTDASLVLRGAVPYRDFYSNYPPGIFWIVALTWKVFGVSVMSERLIGVALRVITAVCAGRLAGRLAGERFSLFACGLVWLWSAHQPIAPNAYSAALAVLLIAIELAVRAHGRGGTRDWMLAGFAYGVAGCLRHDLFVYTALWTLVALAAARLIAREPVVALPRGRALFGFALALVLPLALTWGWVALHAGIDAPLHDLSLDQARWTIPARAMPFPAFTQFRATQIALVLDFAAPLCVLAAWTWWRCRAAALLVGPLALAVLPQMLFISDGPHVQAAVVPALILASALLVLAVQRAHTGLVRTLVAASGLALLVGGGISGTRFRPNASWVAVANPRWGIAREEDADLAAARQHVIEFVARHTRTDEPIFVGCARHDLVDIDEMDLYFLCDRPGATRRMQFDPGLIDRDDVQAGMVGDLEASKPPVVVLSRRWPGKSRPEAGSKRLDEYLRRAYVPAETAGPYELLLRAP